MTDADNNDRCGRGLGAPSECICWILSYRWTRAATTGLMDHARGLLMEFLARMLMVRPSSDSVLVERVRSELGHIIRHPAQGERHAGHVLIIGGTMGTASYILVGTTESERRAWSSASHGARRAMSRYQALKQWRGRELVDQLAASGILIRTRSWRGAAEQAPGAYKDVDLVAEATERAGLARRVA